MAPRRSSPAVPQAWQAGLFHALAHPVRLQILEVLRPGEACVCHIQAMLGLRQAHISQHLMELRRAGLVISRKEGMRVYYRAADPRLYAVLARQRARSSLNHGALRLRARGPSFPSG